MKAFATALFVASAVARRFLGGLQWPLLDDPAKVPGHNPLNFCGDKEDYLLSVDRFDFNPEHPVPGQNLTIYVNGTLSQAVERGSKVILTLRLLGIQFSRSESDLCDYVESGNATCPLEKGTFEWGTTVEISGRIPAWTYGLLADAWGKLGKRQVFCIAGDVSFG